MIMALMNDPKRDFLNRQRDEEIKKNPYLGMNLGDLVTELLKVYSLDSNVIKPQNEIPKKSLSNYKKYRAIIDELNSRERRYGEERNPVIG
jgi:hypothetical protein